MLPRHQVCICAYENTYISVLVCGLVDVAYLEQSDPLVKAPCHEQLSCGVPAYRLHHCLARVCYVCVFETRGLKGAGLKTRGARREDTACLL